MTREFLGNCAGVRLVPRGDDDNHICVEILAEDDGTWQQGNEFSSFWLDELIAQLQAARRYIKTQKPDPEGFGYEFKT